MAIKAWFLLIACIGVVGAEECHQVGPAEGQRLAEYLVRAYHVPAKAALRIEHEEAVGDTCYRKIVLSGEGALGTFRVTVFASPDLRFLSTDLFDSSVDPERQGRTQAKETMSQLLAGEYAASGSPSAPVTLVLFSDFQCPYCKRMRDLLAAEPLVTSGDKIRLVFRHMPLSQHEWAEKAAEAAACAQFQSSDAFWHFHDGLFES